MASPRTCWRVAPGRSFASTRRRSKPVWRWSGWAGGSRGKRRISDDSRARETALLVLLLPPRPDGGNLRMIGDMQGFQILLPPSRRSRSLPSSRSNASTSAHSGYLQLLAPSSILPFLRARGASIFGFQFQRFHHSPLGAPGNPFSPKASQTSKAPSMRLVEWPTLSATTNFQLKSHPFFLASARAA